MYWLFTTAPQAVAALVGIIFTGMFFMAESIDNRAKEEPSLLEIAEAAKTALYKNMKVVALLAAITILYDLILTAMVVKLSDRGFCGTNWLIIGFAVLNISAVYITFKYVLQAVNPNYFNKIAANLSSKYMTGEINSSDFINHYIAFERAARNTPFVHQMNDQHVPNPVIIRMLVSHEIINRDEAGQMFEINKIRNLIVHGEPIEKVDRKIDETLQEITNKIIEATEGRQ